ncbi:SpoIID/LytB domain-containing protein [Cellulomonas alba]|uniref:SpoIID/LytB domain-containing protein n=1 Tax=Cellulomonas alba TaxID=3053467 RepID=A0ABT7SCV6_9CELL|nr:SpoIID/LytB domain-containing protein [Cellulomonas alba]MDM7854019.1 SpoIID/LytB domain-containing protein [Cellulomonas alba]
MRHRGHNAVTRARRLAAVATTVLAAVALLVVGLPSAAEAATGEQLTISSASSVHLGSGVTISAGWTKAGKPVTGTLKLQRKSGTSWVKVASTTVTNGKGSLRVTPAATTTYRWRSTTGASPAKTVTVIRSWISFQAPTAVLPVGKSVTLNIAMTLDGKQSGRAVTLQRKSGSSWVTAAKLTLPAPGKGSVTLKPTSTTTYRIARGTIHSAARTVTVDRDWSAIALSSTSLPNSTSTTTATISWYAAGKAATGSITLQQKTGSTWSTVRTVAVTKGTATLSLKPVTPRSYRVVAPTSTSAAVKVNVAVTTWPSYTIHGSGWGHGVGMSQYGAYGMAQAGNDVAHILGHYYGGTTGTASKVALDGKSASTTIAVQVYGPDADYGSSYADNQKSVTATVNGGSWTLVDGSGAALPAACTAKTGTVTLKAVGTTAAPKISAYAGTSTTAACSATSMKLTWATVSGGSSTPYVTLAGPSGARGAQGAYRHGSLTISQLTVGGSTSVNVVNTLKLETEYLYGIAEMPSSWAQNGGAAALQAQVIAARSYAEIQLKAGLRSDCGCNLVDDARDQNFTGWKKENEGTSAVYGKLWVAAVNATVDSSGQGKVLEDPSGNVLRAYYFSSSGGATLNSEDVWVSALDYLRSVSDPYSKAAGVDNPYASWTATLTQANAAKLFGLTNVVNISLTHYAGGGLKSMTATSSTGATSTISGKTETMRSKLDAYATGAVRAAWVSSITGTA